MANAQSLLARWMRGRKAATPRAPEPADMGTAYGMECTLEQRMAAGGQVPVGQQVKLRGLGRWLAGKPGN